MNADKCAKSLNRPQLQAAPDRLDVPAKRRDVDGIVVTKADRLSRFVVMNSDTRLGLAHSDKPACDAIMKATLIPSFAGCGGIWVPRWDDVYGVEWLYRGEKMQIRRVALAVGLVLALPLAGCATAPPAGSGADLASPTVPAGVNLSEWRQVEGAGVMTVTPAFSYATLQELADASELVVTGTVVEQHPFPDHDLITTESIIEVTEVIKGTLSPGTLRLYTIGTPVYLPEHLDVDGVGDPPLFDKTYVMFLTPLPELTNAAGDLVPVQGVWTAIGSGQYAQNGDGTLHWDGDNPGGDSGPEPVVTMDKVRSVSIG